MLYSYLPLLKGWIYSTKNIDYLFTVPKGGTQVIDEAERDGWLFSSMCSLSDPNAEFDILFYGPYKGFVMLTLKPVALKEAGLIAPNPTGMWCSRYDDTAGVYVVCYTPTVWMPFISRYKLSVKASKDEDLTVYNYSHVLVAIEDRSLFIKSLQEVFGEPTIERFREALGITRLQPQGFQRSRSHSRGE